MSCASKYVKTQKLFVNKQIILLVVANLFCFHVPYCCKSLKTRSDGIRHRHRHR